MPRLVKLIFGLFIRSFRARRDTTFLENLALRQQFCALARRRPQPRFSNGPTALGYAAAPMVRITRGPDPKSNRRPLCAGIEPGSSCTGNGFRGPESARAGIHRAGPPV